MNDTSRKQGWAITGAAVVLGLLFLAGILNGSYLALAVPVAILTFFVLGLIAWVGHTIATVEVEAPSMDDAEARASEPTPARRSSTDDAEARASEPTPARRSSTDTDDADPEARGE